MQSSPQTAVILAPGAWNRQPPNGLTLEARLHEALAGAKPETRVMGDPIPQRVHDACDHSRALLTTTFVRAFEWLIASPRVLTERLYDVSLAFLCHVRARRGEPVADLAAAMRAEEATNIALNARQWCHEGAITLSDVYEIRRAAGVQMLASRDLMFAADAEIARRLAPPPARQALAA